MAAEDDPRLHKGIDEFNDQLFFECHETLEEIWLEDQSEDRKFYQGLIQVAAGYFKLQQQVPAGALKLWRTGIDKLRPYAPVFLGVDVEGLVAAVQRHLADLERAPDSGIDDLQPPKISRAV
jgi:predicted metal-dependent hydrolase